MYQLARTNQDKILKAFLSLNGFFSVLAVGLIFLFLLSESLQFFSYEIGSFSFTESWYPAEGQYNLLPMVLGTLLVTLGSVVIAIPLGLFSSLFIVFYSGQPLRSIFKRLIELYTGIPSVVFGFWALMKIVPMVNELHSPGQSLLAGVLVLALMVFPILTMSLVASFTMASKNHLKVSESLGLRKSTYIWKILLPTVRSQAVGGVMLSTGRALGETMAVLMVCGNIVKVPGSVFDPVRTLTANIALEMSYAMDEHRASLFFSGLILFFMVGFLSLASGFVNKKPVEVL